MLRVSPLEIQTPPIEQSTLSKPKQVGSDHHLYLDEFNNRE